MLLIELNRSEIVNDSVLPLPSEDQVLNENQAESPQLVYVLIEEIKEQFVPHHSHGERLDEVELKDLVVQDEVDIQLIIKLKSIY